MKECQMKKQRPVTLVVLTKYKEVLLPFIESLEKLGKEKAEQKIVFVVDPAGDVNVEFVAGANSSIVKGPEKFSMAGNGNLGLKAVNKKHDILYVGDDVRFVEEQTIERLQEQAYSIDDVGILSPRIIGRGSPAQVTPLPGVQLCPPIQMWFPCVYIKRELIDKIGYLDEQFSDFGCDDLDYCIRAMQAGYKIAVTSKVSVMHEASLEGGPTTFIKSIGVDAWQKQQAAAQAKLTEKYGLPREQMAQFVITGDLKLLDKNPPVQQVTTLSDFKEPAKDEAMAFLRTRHIYVATPAYGGWIGVDFANSLMALHLLGQEIGLKVEHGFLYNESLITRARNIMVGRARQKSKFTDFFFIDADISFDAKDIVSLILHKEEIVGAPCARKHIKWERIQHMVKKAPADKYFSNDEMRKFCGEYVMNFLPGVPPPKSFNLGEMMEVREVGTGVMRIRREVFDIFEKFYPDRKFRLMDDEHENPLHEFFQAKIDEDTKKDYADGVGMYIPEDYAFCRDARKAGMKVYLAPWIKTMHMGTYMFEGDLASIALAGGGFR